ncbi:hypothetical protein LTS10_009323 [Elasticomyces elasticus]|nr:hypothetical protein LTS10_009323 [Elasticomyces elasticus]
MPINLTILRLLGDLSHTASKGILIHSIHSNRSAEGVSLLTQLLYIAVFLTRYLDLFWVPPWWSWWNTILKLFYIGSSAYIVWLMMRKFARTREKERGWQVAVWSFGASVVGAPVVCILFRGWKYSTFTEVVWTFSIILESLAVLPQLLLLRQTTVPTVLDSFYLVTLGSYRMFYLLNWFMQSLSSDVTIKVDMIAVVFGLLQTALYVDFAWVYWTRQRVKLRGGGVVDGEDLSKSFLVRRFIGNKRNATDEDEDDAVDEEASLARQENGTVPAPARRPSGRNWGARGISVSADDTLAEHDRATTASRGTAEGMADPAAFEDDDDDADLPPPVAKAVENAKKGDTLAPEAVDDDGYASDVVGSSAEEWQENHGGK